MFDLFRSREKSVRILLGVLLGLVALSMVTYLIPGGYGTGSGSPAVVAEIGGEPVTLREVQFNLQAMVRNKGIPPGMEDYFVPQLIQQMVSERALAYEAQRLGFQVSDEDVANTIRSIIPADIVNDPQMYREFLTRQGTSVQDYENGIRKQMMLVKLRNLAAEGVIVAPQEVENEYKKRNEKVKIEYVSLSPDKVKSQLSVTPDEVQKYFTTHAVAFRIPEKRSYDLVVIDQDKLAQNVQVSDAELQRAYQANIDSYRTPERVHARHILVNTLGKPKEEAEKLKAKAEDLLKKVKSGGDFAALAKANSDDPGSKEKGGDLGWFGRGQMVKNFETAAFSLKPNEISNLIQTEYGYHIIQVLEKEEARVKPLDEVKDQLLASAKRQKVVDKLQQNAEQVRAALAKSPGQAEQIAQKFDALYAKADKVATGDALPLVGNSGDFENAVKSLKQGEVTPAVQVSPTRYAVAVLTGVEASRQAQLPEVEAQVRQKAIADKANEEFDKKKKELADKAKEMGGDLKKVAQSMGLEVKTTGDFSRAGAAEGLGPAGYVSEAFDKPVGTICGPVVVNGNAVVYKPIDKTPADMGKLAVERDGILDALKAKKARERNDLFEDGVVNRLIKEGKVKIYEDQVKRLSQQYRG